MKKQNSTIPYTPFLTFVFRTPYVSFPRFAKTLSRLEADESHWQEFLKDPSLQEAIFLGSPVLYDEIQKFLSGALVVPKEVNKLKMSVLRYYTRMSTRCTPFGLFAGFSLGQLEEASEMELVDAKRYSRYTRLDMNYLCNLAQDICKLPEARRYLKYFPNSSIYPLGEKLRYVEYYYKDARRIHNINAVDNSEYVGAVLDTSRTGAKIEALAALLTGDDITLEEATAFIHELIDNQILVSELDPAVTGRDFLAQVLGWVFSTETQGTQSFTERHGERGDSLSDTLHDKSEKLTKISALLSEIDASAIGSTLSKYADIEKIVKEMGTAYEAKFLFQTDMFKPVNKAMLDKKIVQNIQEAMALMNKISIQPSETLLSKFAENYYERYEGCEMPLLQVLDTENGIGYRESVGDINPLLEGYALPARQSQTTDIKWNRIQSVLLKKILEAYKTNAYSVEIADKDFDFLTVNWDDLPATMPGMCEIFSNKAGEPLVYVHGSGGSSAANMLGRFCHVNQELENYVKEITDFEQAQNLDVVYAEIVHLPESRTGNILLRPVLRPYEIPYLSKSSVAEEFQIPLSDLYVSVNGKNVFLRSKRLNKRVVPRLSTAHNFSFNSMPVYHFLCDMQTQGLRGGIGFSWGSLANEYEFLPRATYKNVVLSLAKWTVPVDDFTKLLTVDDKGDKKDNVRGSLKSVFLTQRRKENAKGAKSKHLIINALRTLRKIFAPLRLIFLTSKTAPKIDKEEKKGVNWQLTENSMHNLATWRSERQLPRYVVLPDGDNDLFVDMESRLSVQTLISVIKKRKSFQLEEFPFDPDNALVKDEHGNAFTNEFVFGFYKSQKNE
ncbi:MAG: lantibiotic dehydratase family protein [Bacteroidales bacterium]|nr:lantibiotic dehydratase family protein [Bacteroidales bacterium]